MGFSILSLIQSKPCALEKQPKFRAEFGSAAANCRGLRQLLARFATALLAVSAATCFSDENTQAENRPDRFAFRAADTVVESLEKTRLPAPARPQHPIPPRPSGLGKRKHAPLGPGDANPDADGSTPKPQPSPSPGAALEDRLSVVRASGVGSGLEEGAQLQAGDRLRTGKDVAARFHLSGDAWLTLAENSELVVLEPGEGQAPRLELRRGCAFLTSPRAPKPPVKKPARKKGVGNPAPLPSVGPSPGIADYRVVLTTGGLALGLRTGEVFLEFENGGTDAAIASASRAELQAAPESKALAAGEGFVVPNEHFVRTHLDPAGKWQLDSPRPFVRSDYLPAVGKRYGLLSRLRGKTKRFPR